jgi:hypothetical protein
MRFTPASESTKSTASLDSRSILRVPSLTSTAGSADTRQNVTSEHEDRAPVLSDAEIRARTISGAVADFPGTSLRHHSFVARNGAGWAQSSSSMRTARGPPVFVNYRPEEMNLTSEGWQFGSSSQAPAQWMGGHPTTPPHQDGARSQSMPPYSPIRIRSGRGARRISLNTSASLRSGPTSNDAPTRGYPVSNRGIGRRNVAATMLIKSSVSNDEVMMLAKAESKEATDMEVASAEKHADAKLPRSVLKRKLPLMSAASTEQSSTGE